MEYLSASTRLAKRFGFKTKAYQKHLAFIAAREQQTVLFKMRKEDFLTRSRETVLKQYPETQAVFDVQDSALRFYSDVLITTATSLNTNRRNLLRAQLVALDAFDYLEQDKEVPVFSREGRHEEVSSIKAEELRTLRHELNVSFEENARVNPELRQKAHARYAQFSTLFFKDEKEAVRKYPELSPLLSVKKQATRYFGQWIASEHQDKVIKDCLNRALKDLSRHIPLPNAEELKEEALTLRSSWMGTHSTTPNTPQSKKENNPIYVYKNNSLIRDLIGKNGIKTGWWPYNPELLEHTNRINSIDNEILKEQWITSFNTQPKEEVLLQFPKSNLLYNKLDAARLFYNEKMAAPYAEEASLALIASDFDKLLNNEPLQAVSEISASVHQHIMERIKHQLQVEGKDNNLVEAAKPFNQILTEFTRIQDSHFNDKDASNEDFLDKQSAILVPDKPSVLIPKSTVSLEQIAEQIKQLKELLTQAGLSQEPLEHLLQTHLNHERVTTNEIQASLEEDSDLSIEEYQAPTPQPNHTIPLDTLRSTAPDLGVNALFNSSHVSQTVQGEVLASQWDIKALTDGLNLDCEQIVTHLLGEPTARDNGQLRFGTNKGSLVVTIKGNKQGLWFDHQTGEGGNLLQLIQQTQQLSFKAALDFAGSYLNHTPKQTMKEIIDLSDLTQSLDKEKQKTIRYARQLANASKPIQGTIAQTYLEKTRGINTQTYSDSIRFISSIKEPESGQYHPALLLIGKNLEGKVQGVQAIFLDSEGNKLKCKDPKRSYGLLKGSAIPVQHGGNIYALAEGAETALSVASAHKNLTVFASLGSMTNFSSIDFKTKNNTIIILADHDKPGNEAISKMNKAIDELHAKGFNVMICKPKDLGMDFNDVLRERGIEGVKKETNQLTMHTSSRTKNDVSLESKKERYRLKKRELEQEPEF